MKKRLLSLLCVLVLTVSVIPAASALEGEAARAADTLSTLGLIDSTYNLDAPATRAQAAVLLVHLAGAEQAAAADNWLAGFRDVPASIAQEVNYAARQGWITGVTATAFRPDAALTANAWSAFLLRMLGYSDKAGDTVYAIGNPLGLGLAVSSGIVSATQRDVERYALPCVMSTADISEGSSGGALLNVYGQAVAVTSGAYVYGNSMYLAVPIDPILTADLTGEGLTLPEVLEAETVG